LLVAQGTTRRRHARTWLRFALLLALLWPLIAWAAARALIVRADLAHADALVVLAGSSAYSERTHLAAELYRAGRAPVILLTNDHEASGWSSAEQRNPLFVERAIAELTGRGVPRAQIEVLPQPVASTYDEARALKDYARSHNLRSLLAVTSAYHSRRALWTLRRVLADASVEIGLQPVAPGTEETPAPAIWWLSARGWPSVAGEYVKLLYYHARY
jgi:uncharacterized SAM-binding protein YcdF (DUF218 family)